MLETGFSLYMSTGLAKNERIINKAAEAGSTRCFTSLHIPEEKGAYPASDVKELLLLCKQKGIRLFCDVSPHTLELLSVSSFKDLKSLGITSIRVDFGLTSTEISELSQVFDEIVLNASTLASVVRKNPELVNPRFMACHNYYPKCYTGLSVNSVAHTNKLLASYGMKSMTFVPGNKELRGPLCEGLPTIEEHRGLAKDVIGNVLELYHRAASDVVLIGDIDVEDQTWAELSALNRGELLVPVDLDPHFEVLSTLVHHDRPDPSNYVFRSQESRHMNTSYLDEFEKLDCSPQAYIPNAPQEVPAGTILVSNSAYARYKGELEITRKPCLVDERYIVAGRINEAYLRPLELVNDEHGVQLIPSSRA